MFDIYLIKYLYKNYSFCFVYLKNGYHFDWYIGRT